MTSKEHQEWVIQKLNEDYTSRLEECNKIIEQQRILIEQQKELIDSLIVKLKLSNTFVLKDSPIDYKPNEVYYPTANPKISPFTCESTGESHSETTVTSDTEYKCTAPKGTICDGKCKDCCYHTILC